MYYVLFNTYKDVWGLCVVLCCEFYVNVELNFHPYTQSKDSYTSDLQEKKMVKI